MIDPRVIESGNVFEGKRFGHGDNALRKPSTWIHLRNPFRPSWGEPYKEVVARMLAAVVRRPRRRRRSRGRDRVPPAADLDHPASLEKRSFLHDPRKRQCTLCSVTSLQFTGDELTTISYSEPAGDLIPVRDKSAPFSAGNAPEARKP